MSEAKAAVSERKGISAIWLVPLVALVLGAWMVVHTLRSQGPEITIVFSTAEGIEADKTKIKVRSVEIGLVESVVLGENLESVVVTARLERAAIPMLREDTQFWVVRPRIGPGGISGVGTLLSGGYIQLEPGQSGGDRREFEGREDPPVTPAGADGLHLKMTSKRAGSVGTGDPILYKGFRVGRIETAEFDTETLGMKYGAFIQAPYHDLINTSTRFWEVSGITLSSTADGIEVHAASLEAVLVGGVTFGLPVGVSPGGPLSPDAHFEIYENFTSVNVRPYSHSLDYVVRFPESVRGLRSGAPVEYRGIRIGRVERILLKEMASAGLSGRGVPIPVLIRLEPGRLELPDSVEGKTLLHDVIQTAVGNGLRASLATGNLLTGRMYVYFDVYRDEKPAEMGTFAGLPTIPAIETGLAGIQQRVSSLLDKLNALPVEDLLEDVDLAIVDLRRILGSDGIQSLPAQLDATLVELREVLDSVSVDSELQARLNRTVTELDRTLQSMRRLLDTLESQPNSVIFNREAEKDPRPPAGTP